MSIINRRSFLKAGAASLGALSAGSSMAAGSRTPHFAPKAKSVIFLHMVGAPSQLDLFDNKPELKKWHLKNAPEELYKGKKFAFITGVPRCWHLHINSNSMARVGNGCQNFCLI